jgi:hypothetical protein
MSFNVESLQIISTFILSDLAYHIGLDVNLPQIGTITLQTVFHAATSWNINHTEKGC